ncbi:unnamed protein product [Adineta ricciae]|uniref:NAD(P)(+)--arginine ADP-ribosyltransferase n=1 Tax=Adineta ricciae TaxID=249248 RepID=A0A815IYW4_ADIRI|nr:unnamed protein product [Adineta ricciae]
MNSSDDLPLSPNASVGNALPIDVIDKLMSDAASAEIESAILDPTRMDESDDLTLIDDFSSVDHITFVRDVVPYEIDSYSSNDLNEMQQATTFTNIRRVQGIKDLTNGRYASILPEIRIPKKYIQEDPVRIAVAFVVEECEENHIIWRLHQKKSFLPDGNDSDTIAFNPLRIEIEPSGKTQNDSYKLPLRMCNNLRAEFIKRENDVFHKLHSTVARRLHFAEHLPDIPRLACVIVDRQGNLIWETFGLSNFIQPIPTGQGSRVLTTSDLRLNDKQTNDDVLPLTTAPTTQILDKPLRRRVLQNFFIVWLDPAINQPNNDIFNSIIRLQDIVNSLYTFADIDECINFITDANDEKVILITSGSLGQQITPSIHDIPQLDSIYIFCYRKTFHNHWATRWMKVKGVFTDIASMYESLKQATRLCDQSAMSISFLREENLPERQANQLNPSFMYLQILKEIILTLDFNEGHRIEFVTYCRDAFAHNQSILKNIDKFQKAYEPDASIQWYTSSYFLHSMLNRALRKLDVDVILKMGFFLQDLHRQISQLHSEQMINNEKFRVYRGQSLSTKDFETLTRSSQGLMSFNSFLSTSLDRNVAFVYAESSVHIQDTIGVLFTMSIDASLDAVPFASIRHLSFFESEDEILFSMNSVFRIDEIKNIHETENIWEISLRLTDDKDTEVELLKRSLENEASEEEPLYRLGVLLTRLGEIGKSEQIYMNLLEKTSNELEKMSLYHRLGSIKHTQGEFSQTLKLEGKALEIAHRKLSSDPLWFSALYNDIAQVYFSMGDYSHALKYYDKVLEIKQKHLEPDHIEFAIYYVNVGLVYRSIGNHKRARLCYEKALNIQEKYLPSNHPDLASTYDNLGNVLGDLGDYLQTISYSEKALAIRQQSLPSSHPDLAATYNNLGCVYYKMGDYSKALSYYEKALSIRQQSLPPNHPDLALSLNNIAKIYDETNEYSKALLYYEKALKIQQETLHPTHLNLAMLYSNIGSTHDSMGHYSKSLSFYEKGLEIFQKTLPADHAYLASSYNNIGATHENMGEYTKALEYYEKALSIQKQSLPSSHPDLALSYSNIGKIYENMGDYPKALSFLEKGLSIFQQSLPSNHPHQASSYNNIGNIYNSMGDYRKALEYYEIALSIQQQSLPSIHPALASSYNNIGNSYDSMGDYSKALLYYERSLSIQSNSLPSNHPDFASSYNNIGTVYYRMGDYAKALSFYEKALEIQEKILPSNHPSIGLSLYNIANVYYDMGEHSKASSYYQGSIQIFQHSLPPDHPHIQTVESTINRIKTLTFLKSEENHIVS